MDREGIFGRTGIDRSPFSLMTLDNVCISALNFRVLSSHSSLPTSNFQVAPANRLTAGGYPGECERRLNSVEAPVWCRIVSRSSFLVVTLAVAIDGLT